MAKQPGVPTVSVTFTPDPDGADSQTVVLDAVYCGAAS